ncbi:MAG TPA: phosphatase PAP2 family protein [Intrasporangium sp.]|nr:phosphatase PAP2 family protein [Intrasporangium sp.]
MSTGTGTQRGSEARQAGRPATRARRLVDALVPALLLALLVILTAAVVQGATVRLDERVNEAAPGQGQGPIVPDLVALSVVDLATPPVWVGALLILGAVLALRRHRWAPLVVTGAATGVLTGTVLLGKDLIGRPAPDYVGVLDAGGAYPSGHTATALICAGVLAELVAQALPARRTAAWLIAAGWTLLVGVALLWLHFHWLSDVLGSLLLGALVLWLLLRWPLRLGDTLQSGAQGVPSHRP